MESAQLLAEAENPGKTITIPEIKVISVREMHSDEMSNAKLFVDFWNTVITQCSWFDPEKEAIVVFLLDTKLQIKAFNLVTLGILDESLCHPREVLRAAVVSSAASFVMMHNHPSGDPHPSMADDRVTRKMRGAADTVDIPLLDHIVVGDGGRYFSFQENDWTIPTKRPHRSTARMAARADTGRH